jgi:hypothetical protein
MLCSSKYPSNAMQYIIMHSSKAHNASPTARTTIPLAIPNTKFKSKSPRLVLAPEAVTCMNPVLDEFAPPLPLAPPITPLEAAALAVGIPNTTGTVSGVLTTTNVSLPPPGRLLTNVLPTNPGTLLLTGIVVGPPVPTTTFNVPLTSTVLPGKPATS